MSSESPAYRPNPLQAPAADPRTSPAYALKAAANLAVGVGGARGRIVRKVRRICHLLEGDQFRTRLTYRWGVVRGFPHRGGPMVQFEGEAIPVDVHESLLVDTWERL